MLALGGWGVHMPYHVTWEHEMEHAVDSAHPRLITIASAQEIVAAVARGG